jgi:hypothetical protein
MMRRRKLLKRSRMKTKRFVGSRNLFLREIAAETIALATRLEKLIAERRR